MALRIFANLTSMRLPSQQVGVAPSSQRPFDRLSSGQRITDRPADVAISSALRKDIRIATTALTNATTGVSLVSVADSALKEISTLLGRMYDLADASASSRFVTIDERSVLGKEFSAIAAQIDNVAQTTQFNGINLLSNGTNVVMQVGIDGTASSQITFSGSQGALKDLGLANALSGALAYSLNSVEAAKTAREQVAAALDEITTRRASFTAVEDRLQVSIANLSSARENISAAENGIKGLDQFEAAGNKARADIVKDAASAVLAQANQDPLSVAKLLEGSSPQDFKPQDGPSIQKIEASGSIGLQKDTSLAESIKEKLSKI